MVRYYSLLRPVGIGTYPKPEGNRIGEIHNFDRREHVEAIGREAWGWIEYEKPLTAYDVRAYDLMVAPVETRTLHYLGKDSWGRYVYEDENGQLWKHTDCLSPRELCIERGDLLCSACGNTFEGEPDCHMNPLIKPVFLEVSESA